MKGDIWYLKLNGEIQAKFVQTGDDMDGECYVAVAWDAMGEKPYPPCEWEFFTDVCIKPDGCGHWYFKGEDYLEGDFDSYYHICGDHCFLSHIRMMCFVWKLATIILTEYYENRQPNPYMTTREAIKYMMEDFFGNEELEDLVESILDGYVIEKESSNEKIAIIEEGDYDLILYELARAIDTLKSMRKTKNVTRTMKHIDDAIDLLTGECSSVRDIKRKIDDARSLAIVDWR